MEKNKVNTEKNNLNNKKSITIAYVCAIVVLSVLAFVCFWLCREKKDGHFTKYNQGCNVDYKVYLKKNDFYKKDYLDENNKYITKLTDYIEADMQYNANFVDELSYKYEYKIDAFVSVIENGENKVLYSKTFPIKKNTVKYSNSKQLNISEKLKIDYHYYNDIIEEFVSIYDLNNIDSVLKVNMSIDINNEYEKKETAVVTLSIPLLVDTMKFDVSNNVSGDATKVIRNSNKEINCKLLTTIGIVSIVIIVLMIIVLLCQHKCTSTPRTIYNKELKKIMCNYGPYIQKLSSEFDTKIYQVLNIEDFRGLLEIRDTIRQPILMSENEEKTMTTFVIPGENNVLYKNVLKINE